MQDSFYKNAKKLLIAVDSIIFGFDNQRLKLLLFKRKIEPFKEEWSLIGSFIKKNENVTEAANRILLESTGIKDVFLKELGSYSDVNRDSGARVISIAHYALIRLEETQKQLTETYQAHWIDIDSIPDLILDHNIMVLNALDKLRKKARYQPIGFELLPEKFTIPQLKAFYDAIYQKELDRRNFRKRILSMNILEKLEEKDKSTSRKGAFLYRFDKKKYENLTAKGFNFEL
jgi:8-oxo-dGTP diphosphatase